MSKAKDNAVIGDICLYGSSASGAGYIAMAVDGRMFGDGEPLAGRGLNDAMWLAALDLKAAGLSGNAWVYAPGGEIRALLDVDYLKYFGDLPWEPAPKLSISYEDIMAAAEKD